MEFKNGAIVLVVLGGKKIICKNSMQVYFFLIENGIEVDLAADAKKWTESANANETYNEQSFDIYMEK